MTSGEKNHRDLDMYPPPDDTVRLAVRDTNRYKIGEVAALVGMSSESIRYYEREGIISPERNPLSGYRYYSAWDINVLIKARSYRQAGFSMEEVVSIMNSFDADVVLNSLANKQAELHQSIMHLAKLMYQLKEDAARMKETVNAVGCFRFEYRPPMHFLQTQQGYDLIASQCRILSGWVKDHGAFILPGGIYEGPGPDDVRYGFFIEDSRLDEIAYHNEQELEAFPSCFCLASSFYSGTGTPLCYSSFRGALDYMEKEHLEIASGPISRIVHMARDGENAYRSLHQLWIPLRGESSSHLRSQDLPIEDILRDLGAYPFGTEPPL